MADRYDIHFQLVPQDDLTQIGRGKLFTFGYKSAIGVRGPHKLANRWLKCLLTTKGSDPLNASYGTGFASLIGSNLTRLPDLIDAVTLFVEDCNAQISELDQQTLPPDDERFLSAIVAQVIPLGEDGVEVYIHLRNAAGLVLPVALPALSLRS